MPLPRDEGPDSSNIGSSSQKRRSNDSSSYADQEIAPLLAPSLSQRSRRHTNNSLEIAFGSDLENIDSNRSAGRQQHYHSSDESLFFDAIMEKVKSSRIAHLVDKFAVESEPGLTNSQLMLNNHDLKPVEPERRQWGPWNFVGFWVADTELP